MENTTEQNDLIKKPVIETVDESVETPIEAIEEAPIEDTETSEVIGDEIAE